MYHTIFKYGNFNVECVKSYKYLGIEFSIAGNFTEARCNLRKKAMKSTLLLKSFINNQHLSPRVALSMFKKLIVPIGTYGFEIWGAYCSTNMCKAAENLPFEKVSLNFGKYILGVNRKACNAGVRGELGIFPVYLDVAQNIIKYESRLHDIPAGNLLNEAYITNVELDNNGVITLFTGFEQIVHNITNHNVHDVYKLDKSEILDQCKQVYVNNWFNTISQESSKVKLYSKEKGRYCRPVIPREQRICKFCTENACDDEIHFLTRCHFHSDERNRLFKQFNDVRGPPLDSGGGGGRSIF